MAHDMDAIRKKLAALQGQRTERANLNFWKPEPGPTGSSEFRIRVVPWPSKFLNESDGPFIERSFYFIGNVRGFLAPKQFGKPDPVEKLIQQLHKDGDKTSAKKLYPKSYAYVAIIVRGDEDKGVQIWKVGKQLHARLLGFFLDEDGGDISHPESGCDLKVTVTQTPGKQYADTTIDMRKNGLLSKDPVEAQKWLDGVPNLEEFFERTRMYKDANEIEAILDEWINGAPSEKTEGTSKGGEASASSVEKQLDEVKNDDKKTSKTKSTKVVGDEDEAPMSKKSNKQQLDDAFAELGLD